MMDLMEALEYVQAYIDNLMVISRGTLEDHLVKLNKVLKRLHDAVLKVNSTKSFSLYLQINVSRLNAN